MSGDEGFQTTVFFDHGGGAVGSGWSVRVCAAVVHDDGVRRWADDELLRQEWVMMAPRIAAALAEDGYPSVSETFVLDGDGDEGEQDWFESKLTFAEPLPPSDRFLKAVKLAGASMVAHAFQREVDDWEAAPGLAEFLFRTPPLSQPDEERLRFILRHTPD